MMESAAVTALGFILLLSYFGLKRVAGFGMAVDIAVSTLLMWMFTGTYAGMMTGLLAGVMISGFLHGVRSTVGYEKLTLQRKKGQMVPMPRWTDVPPKYRR